MQLSKSYGLTSAINKLRLHIKAVAIYFPVMCDDENVKQKLYIRK